MKYINHYLITLIIIPFLFVGCSIFGSGDNNIDYNSGFVIITVFDVLDFQLLGGMVT